MRPIRNIDLLTRPASSVWTITRNVLAALCVIWLSTNLVFAQDEDEPGDETEETAEVDEAIEEVTVVGTRLSSPDQSQRIDVISQEMIEARGLSTAEDIIRSVPQNFSSINSATNLNFGSSAIDTNQGALGLGISTANLRGFGSANTLVLVNGKRIAGKAGTGEFFTNLRDIPAGAIERVEILLDGGATIYGSDAVGGVINFILKKDYRGGTLSFRQEDSSTGADQQRLTTSLGYSWGTGGITTNVSYLESSPVLTSKTGYTTKDYSPYFGGNQEYNFYHGGDLKSAGIGLSRWGPFTLTLGEGNDGRNAQPSDFRQATPDDWSTEIESDSTGSTEDLGFTIDIEHSITESFYVNAEYSRNNSYTNRRVTRFGQSSIEIPASNAFNPFGRTVWVSYNPQTEIDLGLLQLPAQVNDSTYDRLLLRASYFINPDWEIAVDWSTSDTSEDGTQWMFGTRQDSDFGDEALQARIEELLSSSDPNVAVNLFGDGTGQNPTIGEMVVPIARSLESSNNRTLEGFIRGQLREMKGSFMELVLGTEQRQEGISTQGSYFSSGLRSPTRDLTAYFAELRIPVVGLNNDIPLMDSLMVSLKLRHDQYDTAGANGSDENNEPIIVNVSFSNTAPYLGMHWVVNSDLTIRGSINEAFRAPTFGDLFGARTGRFQGAYDVLCQCRVPSAFLVYGPNPDLNPEYSDNLNLGFDWIPAAVPGLRVRLDYAQVDFQDRIAHSSELGDLLPLDVYAYLPQFFTREEDGTLIETRSISINIARRLSQTLDLNISKAFQTAYGSIVPSLYLHYVLDMYDQAVDGATKARFLEEIIGIDKYSLNGTVAWIRDNLSVDVALDYTPRYTNNAFENTSWRDIPNSEVGSRTTVDVGVKYSMDQGITLRGGARNIFNRKFPFTINSFGQPYDPTRVDLRGRVFFLDVTYEFNKD